MATGDIVNRVGIPKVSAEGIEVNVRVGPTVVRIVVITIPRSVMTGGTTNIEINVDVIGHVRLMVVITGKKVVIPNMGRITAATTKIIAAISPAGMILTMAVAPRNKPRTNNARKGMMAVVGPTIGVEADKSRVTPRGNPNVNPHLGAVYATIRTTGRNMVKTIHGPITGVNVPDRKTDGKTKEARIDAEGAKSAQLPPASPRASLHTVIPINATSGITTVFTPGVKFTRVRIIPPNITATNSRVEPIPTPFVKPPGMNPMAAIKNPMRTLGAPNVGVMPNMTALMAPSHTNKSSKSWSIIYALRLHSS